MSEQSFSEIIGPLDRFDFAQMSVATDDPNLVHIDHLTATSIGLPSVIGSGGLVMGFVESSIRRHFGLEALRAFDIRMSGPVLPDEPLSIDFRLPPPEQEEAARDLREDGNEILHFEILCGPTLQVATGVVEVRQRRTGKTDWEVADA